MESKPLTALTSGVIVIVGAKNSNFDTDIKTHPRVILWDSQEQDWWAKDLPTNCRAVFITRFIGHAAFGKIITEARKRQITIFNPQGTGRIAESVRQLLGIKRETMPGALAPVTMIPIKEITVTTAKTGKRSGITARIRALVTDGKPKDQFDRIIQTLRKEGISATEASIKTMIGVAVREQFGSKKDSGHQDSPVQEATPKPPAKSSVEKHDLLKMLDDVALNIELIRGEVIRLTELQSKLKEFIK